MKIALSHHHDIKGNCFLIEKEGESLEKTLLTLGTLLVIANSLDRSFHFEIEDLIKILKEEYFFTTDEKKYSSSDLLEKNKVIDCGIFKANTMAKILKQKSEKVIFHIDLYFLWDAYVLSSPVFEKINKEIEDSEKFSKKIYQKLFIIIKNQYKFFYVHNIKKLNNRIKKKEIKKWFLTQN